MYLLPCDTCVGGIDMFWFYELNFRICIISNINVLFSSCFNFGFLQNTCLKNCLVLAVLSLGCAEQFQNVEFFILV